MNLLEINEWLESLPVENPTLMITGCETFSGVRLVFEYYDADICKVCKISRIFTHIELESSNLDPVRSTLELWRDTLTRAVPATAPK